MSRKNIAKTVSIGALLFLAHCGTFRNNSGIPLIYNKITKDSSGICVGLYNEIPEGITYSGEIFGIYNSNKGKILGGQIAVLLNVNSGEIYGNNLALVSNASVGNYSVVEGLEASIVGNMPHNSDVDSWSETVGVQFGIFNYTTKPNDCYQIGIRLNPKKKSISEINTK
jgi:hypothetical protein